MKKISVIVPVYNGEKYVEKCVEHLMKEKDFFHELIVVNDGSQDNTKDILKRYESDEKIVVISQDNSGVSAARNRGIEASTGDWIVFCDVDDEINEGYLCDIAKTLEEETEADLFCYARGKVGCSDVGIAEHDFDKGKAVLLSLGRDVDNLLNDYIFMSVWSKVFKREILDANRIRFNEKVSYAEDVLFLLQYLLKTKKVCLIHRGYYFYLPNDEGACKHGGSVKDYDGFFEFDREMRHVFKEASFLKDEAVQETLRKYMFSFGRIMCGRVVKGTVGEKMALRSRMVKDICKEMTHYREGASVKQRLICGLKTRLTYLYILVSDREHTRGGKL